LWTRDEENSAARLLQEAAATLFAGSEPDSPKARRERLRVLLASPSAAATTYTEQREVFLQQHMGAVRKIAAALSAETSSLFDELLSHGADALVDAVDSWRPRQGVRFFSFAYVVIRSRMLQRLRSHRSTARRELPFDDSAAPSPEDLVVEAEAAEHERERIEWLRTNLRRLSTRQRIVVDMLYRQLRTMEQAAEVLGVSQQAISALKTRALRTLREAP
jgi:RNA polymerase sigma factor (sigma-70 family)